MTDHVSTDIYNPSQHGPFQSNRFGGKVAKGFFLACCQERHHCASQANVKLTLAQIDEMGNDFETTSKGYIDFLLLDEKGFPLVVLEAKAEDKNPLIGKEQSRKYARSQNCRFVILSNGNLHYL